VPVVAMHCPPWQLVPPVQGMLQPPQWVLLLLVSTQALPHNIRPATAQPQTPLLQASAPAGQALQPPQCAIVPSPVAGTHAPPAHIVCPDGHIAMQVLLLQLGVALGHIVQLGPQCVASDQSHCPLQLNRPVTHWHIPFEHVLLAPQAVPQAPQFWLSVATVLHCPLQSIWPALQLLVGGVLVGVAQLAASIRQPKAMVRRAEDQRGRVVIDLPRR
jgi:hypothetical protein